MSTTRFLFPEMEEGFEQEETRQEDVLESPSTTSTTSATETPPRLFLLDGSALAYRNHFALSRSGLTNSRGEPTGAIYGTLNQLLALLERESPDYIAVVFDASGPTFRHEMYEEYKATREKMPDELRSQLPVIKKLIEAMGITLLEQQGVEADDVIGTLSQWGARQGWDVLIVSGDKDFAQLVTPQIRLYDPGKRGSGPTVLGPEEVKEKFGVRPDQIIDYLALIGDSSDNVPGVPKVGPKTAVKYLDEYDSLDQLYANLDALPASQNKRLADNREKALLSRELVTILCDVEVTVDQATLTRHGQDHETLREVLLELEFNKLIDRLLPVSALPTNTADVDYQPIDTMADLERLIATIQDAGEVTLAPLYDYDERVQRCHGLAFATQPHKAWYVSLSDDANIAPSKALEKLRPILESEQISKVGYDVKEAWIALAEHDISLRGVTFDVMLASHLLIASRIKDDLETIALRDLGFRKTSEKDVLGTGRKKRTWPDTDENSRCQFCCEEADIALQLTERLRERIQRTEKLQQLLEEFDLPLIPILGQMEQWGVAIDTPHLEKLKTEAELNLAELQDKIAEWSDDPDFNVQSPKQVADLLFEKLSLHDESGIELTRTEKTGSYKTNKETLEALADQELPQLILQYRDWQKRLSTYIDPLLSLTAPDEHGVPRIHTRFRQTGTVTGRLSSVSPNLQNIPIRTPEGREIRKAFIAGRPDWTIVSADYSQVELRILAHITGDPELSRAFLEGQDIHTRTASAIFGVFPDFVTPEQRSAAKAINFGIIYGMGPPRLSKQINVSVQEAKQFIRAYFSSYPKVKRYLDETIAHARKHKYVETLFGRRREIPEINSNVPKVKAHNEHIAVNTPIQGTAADLIKKAMINIAHRLHEDNYQARLLLQIHDELLFEAPMDELDRLQTMVRTEMRNAIQLDIPLIVDVNHGPNWAEAH